MPDGQAMAIILLIAAIAAIVCFLIYRSLRANPRHRASLAISAFGAALSGAVFATIVGMSINYFQRSQEAAERVRVEQQHETEIKNRIVALTKRELSEDLDIVTATKAAGSNLDQAFIVIARSPLKTEFWKSVLSSGDLKSLRDYDLLYSVAEAYAQISTLRDWEDRLAGIVTGIGRAMPVKLPDGREVSLFENVYGWITPSFNTTEEAIKRAIAALDKALGTPNK
jgi:hypothetical protein